MRHIEPYQLFEKKSVGVIYHFTEPKNLVKIIEEDRMHSGHGHISFSRNFDLKSWYEDYGAICRITFNGSDMSNKFHFEPYLFDPAKDPIFGGGQSAASYSERKERYGQEMEERVMGSEIKGINKYIVQIDILDMPWNDLTRLKKEIGNIKLRFPINYVDKFTPVKNVY